MTNETEWRTEEEYPSGVEKQQLYKELVCLECGGTHWKPSWSGCQKKDTRYYYDGDNKKIGNAVDAWRPND